MCALVTAHELLGDCTSISAVVSPVASQQELREITDKQDRKLCMQMVAISILTHSQSVVQRKSKTRWQM